MHFSVWSPEDMSSSVVSKAISNSCETVTQLHCLSVSLCVRREWKFHLIASTDKPKDFTCFALLATHPMLDELVQHRSTISEQK